MAVKDHTNHFAAVQASPTPPDNQVPNTVSRSPGTGERAFIGVVAESGKPVLDAELNLHQSAQWMEDFLLRRWQTPSGWLRGRTHLDAYCDWSLEEAPAGVTDDSGLVDPGGSAGSAGSGGSGGSAGGSGPLIADDGTLLDSVILPRLEATVAGHPVVVEYTNTKTPGYNLIGLTPAKIYDGTNATVKRTDMIFLEVWRSLVAPSPFATGQVQVIAFGSLIAGDIVRINGIPLTAVAGVPGLNQFQIGASNDITATNIAAAINLVANSFDLIVTARATTNVILLTADLPGAGDVISQTGNFITLSVTVATVGAMVASGATLVGGADRPNKPSSEQDKIYRHGNVLSPSPVWLDDELVDPIIAVESSQRIQLHYRIRTTSDAEALNYKKHPDGFSNLIAGGGPNDAAIFAQGNRSVPVWAGNGVDTVSYPFVPADKTKTWLQSSAVAYGWEDDGLYVAGDGSATAAANLGALDGFVFAIPIAFVHRHNNVSDMLAGFKGFDPESNANGAPMYGHTGYVGPLGNIPAGDSDRPDGEFANVITTNNILDLRRHVIFPGVDLAAELKYQVQSLMDGTLRSWSVDTASKQTLGGDSGDVSTRYLICNEVGRTESEGATPPLAGENTERGELIRSYDHICRRFADQPVVERVVIAFWPGDRNGVPVLPGTDNPGKYIVKDPADAATWYEGDTLNLDLEFLNSTTLGGLFDSRPGAGLNVGSGTGIPDENFLQFAPAGTVITDVLNAWHDDGHYDQVTNQNVQLGIVKGLGTTHLEVTLDANDTLTTEGQPIGVEHKMVGSGVLAGPGTFGSPRRIFMEVEITYPIGVGTTDTPDHEVIPDTDVYSDSVLTVTGPGPLIENDVLQRPADFENLLAARYRSGFREVQTEYVANDTILHAAPLAGTAIGVATVEQIVSTDRNTLRFPRRVYGDKVATGLYVNDVPGTTVQTVNPTTSEFGSSSRIVELVGATALSGVGHTLCDIRYFAQDPIPNYGVNGGGYQVAYYFRSNSPQTAGTKEGDITSTGDGTLPTSLLVEALLVSPSIWTGQVGMGGHELGFPYESPLDQIPINDGTLVPAGSQQISGTTEEWYFAATAEVALDHFDADTGLLNLHAFVQMDVQDDLSFGGSDNEHKPRKDAEFRAYYPFADDESYRPTLFAQPLFGATRHKSFTPFLARAVEDVPGVAGGLLFRKSELLLIVLSRFAELDDENNVRFIDPQSSNRTLAAVYRTRNLLLTVGDRTCLGS
jgi:hypothetical protein